MGTECCLTRIYWGCHCVWEWQVCPLTETPHSWEEQVKAPVPLWSPLTAVRAMNVSQCSSLSCCGHNSGYRVVGGTELLGKCSLKWPLFPACRWADRIHALFQAVHLWLVSPVFAWLLQLQAGDMTKQREDVNTMKPPTRLLSPGDPWPISLLLLAFQHILSCVSDIIPGSLAGFSGRSKENASFHHPRSSKKWTF